MDSGKMTSVFLVMLFELIGRRVLAFGAGLLKIKLAPVSEKIELLPARRANIEYN